MLRIEQMREMSRTSRASRPSGCRKKGIVDYKGVCAALARQIHGRVLTNTKVTHLGNGGRLAGHNDRGGFRIRYLDQLCRLAMRSREQARGAQTGVAHCAVPRRILQVKAERQQLVRNRFNLFPTQNFHSWGFISRA